MINTRFTVEKGYIVESKRGGGGYIRIMRIRHQNQSELIDEIIFLIGDSIPQRAALDILDRLLEEELITAREAKLMLASIDRTTLAFQLPLRDELRARILKSALTALKYLND